MVFVKDTMYWIKSLKNSDIYQLAKKSISADIWGYSPLSSNLKHVCLHFLIHFLTFHLVPPQYLQASICYLAAPGTTLGHYRGGSLTNLMLITALYLFRPVGYRGPCNVVGSLSLDDYLGLNQDPSDSECNDLTY